MDDNRVILNAEEFIDSEGRITEKCYVVPLSKCDTLFADEELLNESGDLKENYCILVPVTAVI